MPGKVRGAECQAKSGGQSARQSQGGRVPGKVRGAECQAKSGGQHQPKAGSSVPGGGGNVGSDPAGRGKMSAQRNRDRCQHGLAWESPHQVAGP